jgi:hypothetical protein
LEPFVNPWPLDWVKWGFPLKKSDKLWIRNNWNIIDATMFNWLCNWCYSI